MAVIDVGADANALFTQLTNDFGIDFPNIDLTAAEYNFPVLQDDPVRSEVKRVDICDVTTRTVGGAGSFDALMEGFAKHLQAEYEANRITGAEYTKAYIAAAAAAMGNAVQFALQKDVVYWQSVTAQIGAITARVQLATAKAQMLQTLFAAMGEKARYSQAKMQTLVASMEYKVAEYNHTNMQPIQKAVLEKQSAGATLQNEGLELDNSIKDFNLASIQPQQLLLLTEQTEAARAQTMDTRTDGTTPVTGSVGKQRELYSQQITSYQRKSELDVAKLWSDAWTVQKTIDEGLTAPASFTNASVDAVLTKLRVNAGIAT
jgi:hypothetical protein